MDRILIDYLRSGRAWILVGSGPSTQMRYPSWKALAVVARNTCKVERSDTKLDALDEAIAKLEFPRAFELACAILGGPLLLQRLRESMVPSRPARIYDLIARWPVPVYLTTNYDDEIQNSLVRVNAAYQAYSNSEDHLAYLLPNLNGAIFKLHGDFRSEEGLILTSSSYNDIEHSVEWEYWRTKLTSVFQLHPMIVVGHSLTDPNFRHVLAAAKKGAGVQQPVIWIAPDVRPGVVREFLEKYRIRVISYDNKDGEHRNLVHLLETVTNFVPPRTSIQIKDQIASVSGSPLGQDAAAPGFFVFNKIAATDNFEEKRLSVVIAALQAALPKLSSLGQFDLKTAMETAGWPAGTSLDTAYGNAIRERVLSTGLFPGGHPKSPSCGHFKIPHLSA